MEKLTFQTLGKDQIEVRPTDTKNKGKATLLLYQTARCPMEILDSTVGPENWQVDYKEVAGSVYCGIGIQVQPGEWIWKWNAGSEGNIGEEKSTASDAFKRAAVNWGIGRELYSTPKVKIDCPDSYYWNDKMTMSFSVYDIEFDEKRKCQKLIIIDKFGREVYNYNGGRKAEAEQEKPNQGFYDLQHPQEEEKKSAKDTLTEFCKKMKLDSSTNLDELAKFWKFYYPKTAEWKGAFQADTLFSRWMATAR